MRWFKHLLTNGDLIEELEITYGPNGYYVFWKTLEVMYKHLDLENPSEKVITYAVFMSNFKRIHSKSVVNILGIANKHYIKKGGKSGISFEVKEGSVHLKCNKIVELADEYTQTLLRKSRDKLPTSSGETSSRRDKIREDKKRIKNSSNGGAQKEFYGCTYFVVTQEKAEQYMLTYFLEKEDLIFEFRQMKLWQDDHPKRKIKNWGNFIRNWLKKAKPDRPQETDEEKRQFLEEDLSYGEE